MIKITQSFVCQYEEWVLDAEIDDHDLYASLTSSTDSDLDTSNRVVTRKCIIVGGASCPPYWLAKTTSHGWNNHNMATA